MDVETVIKRLNRGDYDPRIDVAVYAPPSDRNRERNDNIVRDYLLGEKLEVMRMTYSITSAQIYNILHSRGVPMRQKQAPRAIVTDYVAGVPVPEIMRRYDVTKAQVRWACQKARVWK